MAYIDELRQGTILELEDSVPRERAHSWRVDASGDVGLTLGAQFEVTDPGVTNGRWAGRVIIFFRNTDPPVRFAVPASDLGSFKVIG
jgi:hypothetical protein